MEDKSAAQQISDIIEMYGGWKGEILAQLRALIKEADPDITEEVKWKMPSLPEGRPVWSHSGILCIAEVFKNDLKLVFFKGANMKDPKKLFNARLASATDRAIEFREGNTINGDAVKALVLEAVQLNVAKASKR